MSKNVLFLIRPVYIHVCELDERINDRVGKFATGELYEIANHPGEEPSE